MYRRILVALEHSAADATILGHARELARLTGAEILLVHVADGWAARHFDQLNLRESEEMKEDRAYLERVRSEMTAAGLTVDIRLAKGDPTKGQAQAKACLACHVFDKGGPNKTGPDLWDVVDRPIASHEGFAYSDDLKSHSGDKWSFENLDKFITNPKGFAPKTKMTFGGIKG